MDVLPKRFGKYGLALHPDKTRLIDFRRPPYRGGGGGCRSGTFDLLGFTHHWARSRRGSWVVKQKTAKDRRSRTLRGIAQWFRRNLHRPVAQQHYVLSMKLRGHYAYFGVTGNVWSLWVLRRQVERIWRKWLSRRSQRGRTSWDRMARLLERYPLPRPTRARRYRALA